MTYPNGEDPLNPNIGDLMKKNQHMFEKIVDYTVEGRVFENKQYDKIHLWKYFINEKGTNIIHHSCPPRSESHFWRVSLIFESPSYLYLHESTICHVV